MKNLNKSTQPKTKLKSLAMATRRDGGLKGEDSPLSVIQDMLTKFSEGIIHPCDIPLTAPYWEHIIGALAHRYQVEVIPYHPEEFNEFKMIIQSITHITTRHAEEHDLALINLFSLTGEYHSELPLDTSHQLEIDMAIYEAYQLMILTICKQKTSGVIGSVVEQCFVNNDKVLANALLTNIHSDKLWEKELKHLPNDPMARIIAIAESL